MKKPILNLAVTIFTIFLSLFFTNSFSQPNGSTWPQDDKSKCKNHSREIPEDSVVYPYASNYRSLVSFKLGGPVQQIILTDRELVCLSKLPSPELKFIISAYDSTQDSTKFIVVEIQKKDGTNYYYDLDDMYPSICPGRLSKSSSVHLCPPPKDCAIPWTKFKKKS